MFASLCSQVCAVISRMYDYGFIMRLILPAESQHSSVFGRNKLHNKYNGPHGMYVKASEGMHACLRML